MRKVSVVGKIHEAINYNTQRYWYFRELPYSKPLTNLFKQFKGNSMVKITVEELSLKAFEKAVEQKFKAIMKKEKN